MDLDRARQHLESLYDRIERDGSSGKWKLSGPISVHERQALRAILGSLGADLPPDDQAHSGVPAARSPLAAVKLNERANDFIAAEDREVIMCLDFGTAMSKAFAIHSASNRTIELALGLRAGYSEAVFPVPSSVFVSDGGKIYLGHEAISQSQRDPTPDRERFDSPKQELSQGTMGDLGTTPVGRAINPTKTPISKEELITLYLAYLTDLACLELERHGLSRYVGRRFARPCWDKDRTTWAEVLLQRMLARAQILADTFSNQWSGLDINVVRAAFDALPGMKVPSFLINEGVPEPVAAASSLMVSGEDQRRGFLVIDVGAGTTDFGLFVLRERPDLERPRIFQIPGTIRNVRQAGDTIDKALHGAVMARHSLDDQTAYGRRVGAELNLRVRTFKERLFTDGALDYNLADDTKGRITLEELLTREDIRQFQVSLAEALQATLNNAHVTWIEGLISRQPLEVVLTGGGARLPMVKSLAEGVIESRGFRIQREPAPLVPQWILNEAPQFETEYPQLAVAIGGASPQLPEMGPEIVSFGGGLAHPTYAPGNLRIKGK